METIDPKQAQRVWQRVRGSTPEEQAQQLEQMILHQWEDAAVYLQLSRRCSGTQSAMLYQLFRQAHAQCSCLKGIYVMMTGDRPKLPAVNPPREPLGTALRGCYGRQMRELRLYEERAADPDYGYVFARMRDQKKAQCRVLLELIGGQGK